MISIIIPTLNEADNLRELLPLLANCSGPEREIIVVDGNSSDSTIAVAKQYGALALTLSVRSRAKQMNHGVTQARGNILYFVHADTRPPQNCLEQVTQQIAAGHPTGCFRFRFDSSSWLLRINSFFTRFDRMWCRGGDQTLYVTREIFEEMGGFPTDHLIMEEYTFIRQVKERYGFHIIPDDVLVSARKYEENGWFRVQIANLIVFNMYRFGASQERISRTYRQLLQYR